MSSNHPIWTQFASNDINNFLHCLNCSHVFKSIPKTTSLKNHYINKIIPIQEEETFTSSIIDNESNYEIEEIVQSNNQISQNNIEELEENQFHIQENNINNINSINKFDIIKNIKSIDVYNDAFKMKIDYNKIKINRKCKIEFK
ncbi:2279_t:CDS:2 [Cetraspora pellucida]|uniref:2279_t:CDS:1 n=1 Tax=Cetraspora pellucida TaxID=1433469 RepID=A0ACA9PKH0_9GLOM|nr:2279_t:CDS:2 [Cetraspora pellucida]